MRKRSGERAKRIVDVPGDVLVASGEVEVEGDEEEEAKRREDGHRPSTYSNQCIQSQCEEATCSQL